MAAVNPMSRPIPPLAAEALVDNGLELLTEEQCLDLLTRAPVGRVGVSIGALPVILPVNFCLLDGAIYFRTAGGTKLEAASDHTVVAFEADDFDPLEHEGWSVLVVGRAETVIETADVLVHLPLAPWAPGERDHVVRIAIELMSGRRIRRTSYG